MNKINTISFQCSAIASKINVTPKGVILSEKLQLTAALCMKSDRSNKFDLCYYGQLSKFATAKIECRFEMGK